MKIKSKLKNKKNLQTNIMKVIIYIYREKNKGKKAKVKRRYS